MYLIQIIAITIWIVISLSALFNFKKTILIWMTIRLLLNPQIAVRYNSPGMSTVIAVDMTLILIYFFKYRTIKGKIGLRQTKFPLTGAFWVTLVSFLLSSIFAIVPLSSGLVATLKYFVSNFGIIFIFFKCLNTEDDVYLYIRTAFCVAIIITCLGLFEAILKDNPWLDFVYFNSPHDESTIGRLFYIPPSISGSLEMRLGMVRAYSTFGIHIAFGTACVFLLYLFMTISKYKFKLFANYKLNAVIILLIAGVLASNSKTPLVGILIMIFAFYNINQIFHPKIILPLVAAFVIVCIFFPHIIENFMTLFDSEKAEEAGGSTVEGRQTQFRIALDMFSMNPLFGNGMGAISILRKIGNNDLILGAESSFMQILPERGLLGIIGYIVTYLMLFSYGKRFLPFSLCFFFLVSLAIMEFATGILDMAIWVSAYFCVIRLFQLRKAFKISTI